MNNPFHTRTPSLSGPATDVLPVSPDDGSDLPVVAVSLYVETGGSLSIVTLPGESRTVNVSNYSVLPVAVRAVRATGTTASGIHALVLS